MKTITKIIATSAAVVALFFSTNANAQSSPRNLGIGLNVGAGTTTGLGLVIGGDIRYQFNVDKQLSIPVTAGYNNFSVKDAGSFGIIPVKAGAKYFFNDSGSGAYGLAELGAGFGTEKGSGTSFVYSPAIGYSWANGLDLAAKYEGYSNNGSIGFAGIRLAYGFSL
ncbi:hypothetical protein OQX63_00395 [Pedobacter sp. PF22-3]|uniref:hypothetical protein n=1 Tax=Pedobacter sp. PF22-3 TaxID=2994467 RepID=UPI00224571AD|nr:hypothetical protein [Pedobacter sp. PF22-3]MCX2491907.1 hypothetical protein [Pedobacter sp. PF22-3]